MTCKKYHLIKGLLALSTAKPPPEASAHSLGAPIWCQPCQGELAPAPCSAGLTAPPLSIRTAAPVLSTQGPAWMQTPRALLEPGQRAPTHPGACLPGLPTPGLSPPCVNISPRQAAPPGLQRRTIPCDIHLSLQRAEHRHSLNYWRTDFFPSK